MMLWNPLHRPEHKTRALRAAENVIIRSSKSLSLGKEEMQ